MEVWKDIEGYEGFYRVSPTGRVLSLKTGRDLYIEEDCKKGSCRVSLSKEGSRKRLSVSLLVAKSFLDNPQNQEYVTRIDGDFRNNNVSNLLWVSSNSVTHGLSKTEEYKSWCRIKYRCYNDKFSKYDRYGGRGIKIFKGWVDDFEAFYRYMGKAPEGTTIDRIDNDGNYEPGNVRWADWSTQQLNKSLYFNSTTGFKGVYKSGDKYRAELYYRKKKYHIGTFETLAEAVLARESKVKELKIEY